MSTTTRALVVTAPGRVELDEIVIDSPRATEVLIEVAATGLCHTDVSWAAGTLYDDFPVTPGHETSGVVVAVGDAVTRFVPGDRVVIALTHHCGHCRYCEAGHPMLCAGRTSQRPRLSWRGEALTQGFGVAGFAAHALVPESSCVAVPEAVPLEIAAVVGCAIATGVGSVLNIAEVQPGSRVAVWGAGGIGLSVVMGAVLSGADEVVVVEPHAARRAKARELGATSAVTPDEFESRGDADFDTVFESAGYTSTMERAIDATRRGGTTVLLGAPPPDHEVRIKALDFVASQKRLLGCITGDVSPVTDFDRYFRLYLHGRLPLDALVTSTASLDDAAALLVDGPPAGEVRVVVRP